MYEEDERMRVEHADIEAKSITVNTGWTERMALWNTLGTVGGFIVGLLGLILAWTLYLRQNSLESYIKNRENLPTIERSLNDTNR